MKKATDTFWPMVLSLSLISIVAGGLLALVFNLTQEPIEQAKQTKIENNLKAILPYFDSIRDTVINDATVYIASANDKEVGYVIGSSDSGYGGRFNIFVSFLPDGTINDYAVLEHQETPGLGSKMTEWFKDKVVGRKSEQKLTVSKDGGDVDAITAATISSRAFLRAVNKASDTFHELSKNDKRHCDGVSGASAVHYDKHESHE